MDLEIANGLGTLDFLTFAQAPADLAAITVGEVAAGVSMLGANGVGTEDGEGAFAQSGWQPTRTRTPAPRFSTKKVGSLHQSESWDEGTLSMYWVDTTHPLYTALDIADSADPRGFCVRGISGNAAGQDYRVWPVEVTGVDPMFNFDGTPSHYIISFALSAPTKGVFVA